MTIARTIVSTRILTLDGEPRRYLISRNFHPVLLSVMPLFAGLLRNEGSPVERLLSCM